ncbi:NHLP bacteriocin system secretion protein [Treponema sp.]|uniref:NHLP bacteriocin system secretion protein n=1 Tax=Treponema sp. TaxID=166 RepID=UPI0025EF1BB8|nr:NHLP bacteriocin system secretion protein [Treponema sp.]MBR4321640.1 NHLP bacteriocin system secretion protein [Treponema sp.]
MKRAIFRKSALDRIASLDQLDQTMTVVKPSSILALISVTIIIFVALLWGICGSVPDTVSGTGVLVNSEYITSVKYSNQGAVKNIFVNHGDMVHNGQIVARIERQDILDQIKVNEKKLDGFIKMQNVIHSASKTGSDKAQVMKSLFDQGLITEQEYLNSRQTEMNIEQQILETKQQILLLNESYQTATQVLATASGRVMEIPVRRGDYVQPGSTIAVIESNSGEATIGALVYFSAMEGKKIRPGMKIGLVPTTVKQEEYGFIQGLITDVSEFPVSDNYLVSSLQNMSLANTFHQIQNPIEVKVSIIPDPTTYSGYKWSSSNGPAQKIGSGYICSARVTTDSKRPISLILPTIKKKLLGVGEEVSVPQQPLPSQAPRS